MPSIFSILTSDFESHSKYNSHFEAFFYVIFLFLDRNLMVLTFKINLLLSEINIDLLI